MLNSEEIKKQLTQVLNPLTGKSILDENRVEEILLENEELKIVYRRDGIDREHKKKLENEILNTLKAHISEDKILLKSISEKIDSNINKNQKQNNPAAHSTIPPKKKIPGVKNVIAVGSGKGGVGKSTVTVNLAMELKNQGLKVGIIDADIYGPSIPMALGKMGAQPLANDDNKMLPLEAHGVKFISFGLFIDKESPVIWRGPMLGKVLNQFFFDVVWGELDVLLIDLPPGTGDVQLSMVQKIQTDGAVIVSTPQDLAFLDARRALEMFKKMELPIIGLVENMSSFICDSCDKEHFIFGHSKLKSVCEELSLPFLGKIPMDGMVASSGDSGTPIMAPNSSARAVVRDSITGIVNSLKNDLK